MAHHTTNPSPLRYYNAFDSAIQGPSSSGKVWTSSSNVEWAPLYRCASYKSSEHCMCSHALIFWGFADFVCKVNCHSFHG
ncbi:hypothetical protein JVT61DRAFT_10331 [Boletus reticuloceps]|uniref:Uncharacterized protein n=1 Tax=Boletus reticuloceps TaxID=495285 RepID=A0A8I3AC01_9AGAM|nr:hypothetical protein JVT61DRAFT_10331 [Boletus reticuloceps]